MDAKTISLWVCIVIFALPALFFGFQKLKQNQEMVANFTRWGYSKLFMIMLGVAEIIATIGLFFPVTRVYSIYVYGVILIGAIGTHIKAKDGLKDLMPPIFVLGLLIAIYCLNA